MKATAPNSEHQVSWTCLCICNTSTPAGFPADQTSFLEGPLKKGLVYTRVAMGNWHPCLVEFSPESEPFPKKKAKNGAKSTWHQGKGHRDPAALPRSSMMPRLISSTARKRLPGFSVASGSALSSSSKDATFLGPPIEKNGLGFLRCSDQIPNIEEAHGGELLFFFNILFTPANGQS